MIDCVAIEKPQDLLGAIVLAKRGRDAGRLCVVVGWLPDNDYLLVADGKQRTVAKPKKKNMKHLEFTQCRSGELGARFLAGEHVTDRMIRVALAAFGEQTGEGRQHGKKRCN
ncbi:MAG: KOW domain-containing RNA-binding protein [Oscillospiraceae bacterium]|nr:KOW domain-containing RNA-binding protein [Oscillospiraceae bacterium]